MLGSLIEALRPVLSNLAWVVGLLSWVVEPSQQQLARKRSRLRSAREFHWGGYGHSRFISTDVTMPVE